MPLLISDSMLSDAGLSEDEARIEFACRLFDTGRLSLTRARRWAGVERTTFESALLARGLPIYRPTLEDLAVDLATLERMERTP